MAETVVKHITDVLYNNSNCDLDTCEQLAERVLNALDIPPKIRDSSYDKFVETKRILTKLVEDNKT